MNSHLIAERIHKELLTEDCLLKKNIDKTLNILEANILKINFKFDYTSDFLFINELIEQYSNMFFEEKLTKRALSYFRNNHLGGDISDDDFEDCLSLITTAVFQVLSDEYKQRINMYLKNEEDEEEDTGIIAYIYLRSRQSLFGNVIEYNKQVSQTVKKKI